MTVLPLERYFAKAVIRSEPIYRKLHRKVKVKKAKESYYTLKV